MHGVAYLTCAAIQFRIAWSGGKRNTRSNRIASPVPKQMENAMTMPANKSEPLRVFRYSCICAIHHSIVNSGCMPMIVKMIKIAMNPNKKRENILSVTVKRARKNGNCEKKTTEIKTLTSMMMTARRKTKIARRSPVFIFDMMIVGIGTYPMR